MSNINVPRYSFWTATAGDALAKEINKALTHHKVIDNARRDARLNLPPAEATELSQVEMEVVQERAANLAAIEEALHKEIDKSLVAQRVVLDDTRKSSKAELITLPRIVAIERENLMEKERANLTQKKESLCETKRGLNIFRRANPATAGRAAKVVAKHSLVLWTAAIVLITILEAVFNAYFWAGSNAHGIAGGFVQALMLAIGNVLPAVLVGKYAFPRLSHAQRGTRALGWLSLLIWLSWLALYNIWLGHYRIAAEAGDGGVSAMNTLMVDPFGLLLTSAEALLLTLAGVLTSLIVSIKVFHLDDPYLGYGAVTHRYQTAQTLFDSSVEALREALAINLKAHLADVSKLQGSVVQAKQKVQGITKKVAQHCEEGRNSQSIQQATLDAVIGTYRDEQTAIRTSVPQYFATNFPKLVLMDFASLENQAGEASEEMSDLLNEYNLDSATVANTLMEDTEVALRNLERYLDGIAEAAATRLNDQAVDYYRSDVPNTI